MKIGGNAKCRTHFQEHGVILLTEKDALSSKSIREKYESQVAQHYKQILQATVKGEAIPSMPLVIDKEDDKSSTADEMAVLAEKVQHEPSLTFSEAFWPLVCFGSKKILGNIFKPQIMVPFASLLAGALYIYPNNHKLHWCIGITGLSTPLLLIMAGTGLICNLIAKNRQPAFKSAQNLLLDRIQTGRAKRYEAYDIFFPPKKDDCKIGLIFYPGALVSHTAYAAIAGQMSDKGILVVVLSLEPLRFCLDSLETRKKNTLNVMYEIISREDVQVTEWALGGHSAGGTTALKLVSVMKPGIRKLVLWGVSSVSELDGISLHEAAIEALVLLASEDGFLTIKDGKEWGDIPSVLPPVGGGKGRTTLFKIDGGNHAGFAHYGPQVWPRKDGTRTITMDEQQQISARKTADFLLGQGNMKQD